MARRRRRAGGPEVTRRIVNMCQVGAAPKVAREADPDMERDLDIRDDAARRCTAPTLVVHPQNQHRARRGRPRSWPDRTPAGARWVERAGRGFRISSGNAEGVHGGRARAEFAARPARAGGEPRTACSRRCCSPTSWSRPKAAELGDARWRETREAHDRAVRGRLARFRGGRSRRWGTDSSRRSTDRREPSAARWTSERRRRSDRGSRRGAHGRDRAGRRRRGGLAVRSRARRGARGPVGGVASQTVKDLTAGSAWRSRTRASTS